ncbi:DUF4132 domain-containing protein [Actinomadura sediminis]|uniref:DUF4132 domain-containing protein n=1 Tax=Actinomadura sediminis TaxID=1038904 RepID=A0ABW3EMY2_9ACTN
MPETPRVPEAPTGAVPPLLSTPPWTRPRAPRAAEPIVVQGLRKPKTPAAESWPPGLREEFAAVSDTWRRNEAPVPDDVDWAWIAEYFRSGAALRDGRGGMRGARYRWLVLDGPDDLARELLADTRYFGDWAGWVYVTPLKRFAARHGLAARPLILHAAKAHLSCAQALVPFVDDATAQFMIKGMGKSGVESASRAWFAWHGPAAAPFVVAEALRKPGPKRTYAEHGIAIIVREHGGACVLDAARRYGDAAVAAMEALGLDPLDRYPDPLPEPDEEHVRARYPQVLLRGREQALPVWATRNLVTMLRISSIEDPYAGCEPVFEHLDPDSLAELAWAVYQDGHVRDDWASPGAKYALRRLGNAETAARLATVMGRWSRNRVWTGGLGALDVLTGIDSPDTLRHLDRLARKAADAKRMREHARWRLNAVARERGLTPEQLADRLVPGFGLDSGGLTLDYGRRRFRVGFDERLRPFVLDESGKRRAALPKPGVKDDPELAPASYKRFADLKKEVRAVAADQVARLEQAMVAGRSWAPAEFREVLAEHPLMRHIARRLVWSAGGEPFRIAEDGTFADVRDDAFALPEGAAVSLPHPLLIEDRAAWAEVFADYEILQPFPQLGRPVHRLTDDERASTRLGRFSGGTAHFGRILGLTSRGWELGETEDGGFRRQVIRTAPGGRRVMAFFTPGIRVLAPEEYAEQEFGDVIVLSSGTTTPWRDLDPVTASEVLNDLTRLTS